MYLKFCVNSTMKSMAMVYDCFRHTKVRSLSEIQAENDEKLISSQADGISLSYNQCNTRVIK